MYILHVNPRESTKWIAPPPEELITTERLVGGEVTGTGADLEQSDSSRARAKETEPGKQCFLNFQASALTRFDANFRDRPRSL